MIKPMVTFESFLGIVAFMQLIISYTDEKVDLKSYPSSALNKIVAFTSAIPKKKFIKHNFFGKGFGGFNGLYKSYENPYIQH